MLSSAAENLFWIARYVERAENIARLVDAARRMTTLFDSAEARASEWASVVIAAGAPFRAPFEAADQSKVAPFLLLDGSNASSVYGCLLAARRNARAVRGLIPIELWEVMNATWIDLDAVRDDEVAGGALADFIDWVKMRAAQFRGVVDGALMRSDQFHFMDLGQHVERADNTSRLLRVKQHVLLPDWSPEGGAVDLHQWTALLRAAGSLRAYRQAYGGEPAPLRVAQLLILNGRCPRSLRYCYDRIAAALTSLEREYGQTREVRRVADAIAKDLNVESLDSLAATGLPDFLDGFLVRNNGMVNQLSADYGFGAGVDAADVASEAEGA